MIFLHVCTVAIGISIANPFVALTIKKLLAFGSDLEPYGDFFFFCRCRIPFKIFSATSASNGSLIKWKMALFQKKNFWQINVHLAGGDWKILISDFQSQFSMSKIIRIFLIFFFIEEYQFRAIFVVIDIFWKRQFLNHFITKMMPNFWQLATPPVLKIQ